jgi:hypothetical protein
MATRVTLKAVNEELARHGYMARLAKASGYFYFQFGEAVNWLDRTVNVPTINSHTRDEWIAEFERLKKLNQEIMRRPQKERGAKTGSPIQGPRRNS